MRVRRSVLAVAVAAVAVLVGSVAPASAATLPVRYSFAAAIPPTLANPAGSPPGANDWACHPSAAHPNPVVLVHGTGGNMQDSWQALSPLLKNNGYCVFALNYGKTNNNILLGLGDIPASAAELGTFVDRVRTATGAAKVDIIGHSQGGMMPRYYLKFLGGAAKVGTLVGLAPSNHGTTLLGLAALNTLFPAFVGGTLTTLAGPALTQQTFDSSFIKNLNAGGDTVPGVKYTVIESIYDEVVTPYTSAFLKGPNVTNITLQSQCFLDGTEHLGIIYDHIALRDALNALDPAHPVRPTCSYVAPINGG